MLQSLGVCVFGGTLDQALTHCIDVLQPGLNVVHLLSLHSLGQRQTENKTKNRRQGGYINDIPSYHKLPVVFKRELKLFFC